MLKKTALVFLLLLFACTMLHAAEENKDADNSASVEKEIKIEWTDSIDDAITAAEESGKFILVYTMQSGGWGSPQDPYCATFAAKEFKKLVAGQFHCVKIDASSRENLPAIRKYNILKVGVAVLNKNGKVMCRHASRDSAALKAFLESVLKLDALKKKVKGDSENKDLASRVELAEAYINLHMPDDALAHIETAYKADPKDANGLLARVVYLLGRFNELKKRWKDAAAAFKKAASLDKEGKKNVKPLADFERAVCFMQLGKNKESAEAFLKFVTDNPESSKAPDALFQLGIAYYKQGDKESAALTFATFADRYPKHELAEKAKEIARQLMDE